MSIKEVMMLNSNIHLPLDDLITGRELGFGDGRHGCIVYDGFFPAALPNNDPKNYYEIHSTYFELPAGKTLKPPRDSYGLIVYSLSDIVINGIIDMKNRGYHQSAGKKDITVYGQNFPLATGGATVQGALSGNGGRMEEIGGQNNPGGGTGGMPSVYVAGISGGSCSIPLCGNAGRREKGTWGSGGTILLLDDLTRKPTGAVILIARGKIVIKGRIDCSASPGLPAENGQTGYAPSNVDTIYVYAGRGGAGAQPPSGGGAITLIAKTIDRTGGVLDVSAKSFTNTTNGSNPTGYITIADKDGKTYKAYYGTGGTGSPAAGYTSQAGNIKEYLYI